MIVCVCMCLHGIFYVVGESKKRVSIVLSSFITNRRYSYRICAAVNFFFLSCHFFFFFSLPFIHFVDSILNGRMHKPKCIRPINYHFISTSNRSINTNAWTCSNITNEIPYSQFSFCVITQFRQKPNKEPKTNENRWKDRTTWKTKNNTNKTIQQQKQTTA